MVGLSRRTVPRQAKVALFMKTTPGIVDRAPDVTCRSNAVKPPIRHVILPPTRASEAEYRKPRRHVNPTTLFQAQSSNRKQLLRWLPNQPEFLFPFHCLARYSISHGISGSRRVNLAKCRYIAPVISVRDFCMMGPRECSQIPSK